MMARAGTMQRRGTNGGGGSLDNYLGTIREVALLTQADERSLAEAIARGDAEARSRLIRANLRLVVKIARDFEGRGLGIEDLIGEGNLGLIRASEAFDPAFGTRFSTYASHWIKQAIRHALITTAATIRLPAHMVGLLTRWRRAERGFLRAYGHPATHDQIAMMLGLTDEKRAMVEQAFLAGRLVRHGMPDDPSWTLEEAADPHEAPDAPLEADDDRRDLLRRLDRLDDRERMIVALRFGLEGQAPLTLKEVGRRLGVTREWVRKIEVRAVRKLDDAPPDSPAPSAPPRRRERADRGRPRASRRSA